MTAALPDGLAMPSGDAPFPLYDPAFEHEACGVGFIASRSGESSYRMVRLAAECLIRLDHRGAQAADGTGDGAGLLLEIPYAIFERELRQQGLHPPARHRLGVFTVFLPRDGRGRTIVEGGLAGEQIGVLAWRKVPVDAEVLGQRARDTLPVIYQVLVEAPPGVEDAEVFERRLFLARRSIERSARRSGLRDFSIPSASGLNVVYKGLFSAGRIEDFYWDLRDPAFSTSLAIFHQRYSTNTSPSWHIAQPFRTLAHNGEINTIRSNRAWMRSRQLKLSSPVWADRTKHLVPILSRGLSDSGSLDEVFELLIRSGRSVAHVKEMLIPEAWENVGDLSQAVRAFYEYHAFLTEPWDGPAAIAATDGRSLVAGMDRNGLRPLRWTLSPEVVVVASEAGVCPEEEARSLATGQLAPGEILAVDLETRTVRFSDEVKQSLADARPYNDWVTTETLYVQHPFDPLQDERFDPTSLSRVFGYTAEERRLVLHEMAHGRTPLGSMGNDTPLAALSEVPRRVSHYLHQAFAQVTNPPMDPIREHGVMSLRTYLGKRGSLLDETPQQAHLIELASPVMSDAEVERIVASTAEGFISTWIPVVFETAHGAVGLRVALDEICDRAELAVRAGAGVIVLSDREIDRELAPVPMLLAVGAVHHRLIDAGLRLNASILAVSAEPRDAHDLATLVAFGASAVNPYLAIELVRSLATSGEIGVDPVAAQENYRIALQEGLLKIMSKMGICTISSYRGSELFELIGLDDELSRLAFRYAPRRIGGVGMDRLAGIRAVSTSTGVEALPTSPVLRWSWPFTRPCDPVGRLSGTTTERRSTIVRPA
jgi:glutamate synthase domain-containing protein 1